MLHALVSATLLHLSQLHTAIAERCARNGVRKTAPSGNVETFEFCQPWQGQSCCTADIAKSIGLHGQLKVDGTSWELCGTLSERCKSFLKKETCFYECEPNLVPWINKVNR